MMLTTAARLAKVLAVLALAAGPVRAQATEGSDRLPPRAVSDSLVVLGDLDKAVAKSKDAAVWYHRGMLAWTLWERSRHLPPVSGLDLTTLAPIADVSLRKASELEPDNEAYFLAVARFLTSSGAAFQTYGAYGVFSENLDRARKAGDKNLIADAALDAGRLAWMRYDKLTCNSMQLLSPTYSVRPSVEGFVTRTELPAAVGPFSFLTPQDNSYIGEADYLKAELLFREAYDAAPTREPTFRRYATLLADQKRWVPLASLAHNQIGITPQDPWAWMALGLASHKRGDRKMAVAAFDTAMQRFPVSERHRLDRIERVLGGLDAANFALLDDTSRAKTEAFYWRNQSPLWSVDGADARIEFLSRVAFAELRWTEEEISLNGVNTGIGNDYVRTGWRTPTLGCNQQRLAWYVFNDTTVLRGDAARWPNLARIRIDTIPTQIARFRSVGDSTDVYFAARPPVAAIAKVAQISGPVRTDFWLLAGGLTDYARDSVRPTDSAAKVFVHRLPPGGFVYRTEASEDGAPLAARGTGGFITGPDARTGFMLSGFGMSDVLLAVHATPRSTPARRWTDFDVQPLVGPVNPFVPISLLWENYDFGQDKGSARYDLSITIQREPPPPAPQRGSGGRYIAPPVVTGKIAASIASGNVGNVATTRTGDKVEFTFERTMPYAPIIPDNIAVLLGKTPPGNYLLTLRVTDRVTGAKTGRTQRLTIPPPPPPKPVLFGR